MRVIIMDKKDLIRWIDDRFLHWGGSVETINSLSSKILCELDNAIGEENATVESIKKKMMDTELYFSCIFDLCDLLAREIEFNSFKDKLNDMIMVPDRAAQNKRAAAKEGKSA